jgi:hypothetical protein
MVMCGLGALVLAMPAEGRAATLWDYMFGCGRTTYSPPYSTSYCAPACCGSCSVCAQPACSACAPQTVFRTYYRPVAVAAYMPVVGVNSYTGYATTVYSPVQSWTYQPSLVPYTSYRVAYADAYSPSCLACGSCGSCGACSPGLGCYGSCSSCTLGGCSSCALGSACGGAACADGCSPCGGCGVTGCASGAGCSSCAAGTSAAAVPSSSEPAAAPLAPSLPSGSPAPAVPSSAPAPALSPTPAAPQKTFKDEQSLQAPLIQGVPAVEGGPRLEAAPAANSTPTIHTTDRRGTFRTVYPATYSQLIPAPRGQTSADRAASPDTGSPRPAAAVDDGGWRASHD